MQAIFFFMTLKVEQAYLRNSELCLNHNNPFVPSNPSMILAQLLSLNWYMDRKCLEGDKPNADK